MDKATKQPQGAFSVDSENLAMPEIHIAHKHKSAKGEHDEDADFQKKGIDYKGAVPEIRTGRALEKNAKESEKKA